MQPFPRRFGQFGVLVHKAKTVFLKEGGFFVDKKQVRKEMEKIKIRSIDQMEGIL